MSKIKIKYTKTVWNGYWIKQGTVVDEDKERALILQSKNLAIPYEEPEQKEQKQETTTKEEKAAYQTKEAKTGTRKRRSKKAD